MSFRRAHRAMVMQGTQARGLLERQMFCVQYSLHSRNCEQIDSDRANASVGKDLKVSKSI